MSTNNSLGGPFTFNGTTKTIHRIGYGAIQLTGPMAWGEPRNRDAALAVVREAIALGINHIDTSDYYGPHIANQIIKEAIHPYPKDLVIVTKIGAKRGADKSWPKALSPEDLTAAVHDNLRNLGLDALGIVNLRVGQAQTTDEASIAGPLETLIKLKEQGLIQHIGLSNVSYTQFKEAEAMTDIVCVQNHYNLAYRKDDALIEELAVKGIAFVPFFPMGGFRPLQSPILDSIAESKGVTPKQIALAWLLQRSSNVLIIAGTSSVDHLRENVQIGDIKLTASESDGLENLF